MTAHPAHPANAGHWWLVTLPAGRRLHAIPADAIQDEDTAEALCSAPGVVLAAACGRTASYTMPGLISRLEMPRCAYCCHRLGIARSVGTPANAAARVSPGLHRADRTENPEEEDTHA